jgi:acyl dehydratase
VSLDLAVLGRESGPAEVSWSSTDALLYAIGVGAGQDDPLRELALTTESSTGVAQQILPTYAIVVAQRARLRPRLGDYDPARLVHAEQRLELHRPLTVDGAARLTAVVTDIYDKGSGALARTATRAHDPETRQPLFTAVSSSFIRGEGGFGGQRGPVSTWSPPDRDPDHALTVGTRPDQALLYRLSGDRNPLHSDPQFAARGGFKRPILHGLATYGITARVLLGALGLSADQLTMITGRFTKPVLPGAKLTVSIWSEGTTHYFRTADEAGDVVLDHGLAMTATGVGQ